MESFSKAERIAEFLRRLENAPPASNCDEALRQLADILNAVENEMTSVPFDPDKYATDGRMYPPQSDSRRDVPGRGDVKRFRSRAHNTFIGDNGAIEIRDLKGNITFTKPGADGRAI